MIGAKSIYAAGGKKALAMTECFRQLTFSFYHHKQLVAHFKRGWFTCEAGLLAVRELENSLGWRQDASAVLSDPPPAVAGPTDGVSSHIPCYCGPSSPMRAIRQPTPGIALPTANAPAIIPTATTMPTTTPSTFA